MDGYSISQVARRTGFSRSALRFYEQQGLVHPGRTASGYRSYDDRDVEQLGFIGRAKRFGLSLDEITELLMLLDQERCSPVQDRLRTLIDAKIDEAETRAADLATFASRLRRVAATLDGPAPDGPCDDTCGCVTDSTSVGVAVGSEPAHDASAACTLAPDQLGHRTADWRAMVDQSTQRARSPRGVVLHFPRTIDVAALARLIAAEQECCRFFTFTLAVADTDVVLEIAAPGDAPMLIGDLIGEPS